jgi:hypothetical protein
MFALNGLIDHRQPGGGLDCFRSNLAVLRNDDRTQLLME